MLIFAAAALATIAAADDTLACSASKSWDVEQRCSWTAIPGRGPCPACNHTCSTQCDEHRNEPYKKCVQRLHGKTEAVVYLIGFVPIVFAALAALWPSKADETTRTCALNFGRHLERLCTKLSRSAIVVILYIFLVAFVVTFYSLLNEEYPCDTALGECSTISCASGNSYFQGYVFMFFCLSTTAILLIKDVYDERQKIITSDAFKTLTAARQKKVRRESSHLFLIMVFGLLSLVLTGIFPTVDLSRENEGAERLTTGIFGWVHTVGVAAGVVMVLLASAIALHLVVEHSSKNNCMEEHKKSKTYYGWWITSMLVTLLFIILFAAWSFILPDAAHSVDVTDHCADQTDEFHCTAWPTYDLRFNACDKSNRYQDKRIPKYECAWVSGHVFKSEGHCIRAKCPLFFRAGSTVLEFAVLFMTLFHLVVFGMENITESWEAMVGREAYDKAKRAKADPAEAAEVKPLKGDIKDADVPVPVQAEQPREEGGN